MTPSWTISLHGNDVTVAFDNRAEAEAFVGRIEGMDLTAPTADQPEGVKEKPDTWVTMYPVQVARKFYTDPGLPPTPASGDQMEVVGFPGIDGKVLTDIAQRGEDDEYQNSPAWLWFGEDLTTFGRWNKGDQVAYIRGDIAATVLDAAQKALAEKDAIYQSAVKGRSDFRQAYRDAKSRAETAEARNAELVKALEDIGRQKKTDELETEYDVEVADFEGGYDACIDTARAALKGQSNEA